MQKDKITIYTDGAARGNPGPAGWGSVLIMKDEEIELGGRADHSTNNIMELTAPIEALKYLSNKSPLARTVLASGGEIEIFSDSKYVITGINEWIHNWIKNGWCTANKKSVLNKELWQELHILNEEFKPKWYYVKGHSGDKYNDRVDEIATSFADNNPVI